MSTSRSKSQSKQQNAGAWFQGAVSPLMIDVPIAPNMFQSMQKGGNRVQERVPLPSRQVNETFAPFKLQQGGGKQYGGTQDLAQKARKDAQKARKDAQHARLSRQFAARRGAAMQADRVDNLPIASRTRSKKQQGGFMMMA